MQEFGKSDNRPNQLELIGAFLQTSNAMLKYQLALQDWSENSPASPSSAFGRFNEVVDKMIQETIENNVGLLHTMLSNLPPGLGKIAVRDTAGIMNGVGYSTAEQSYVVVVTDESSGQQQQVPFNSVYQLDLTRNS